MPSKNKQSKRIKSYLKDIEKDSLSNELSFEKLFSSIECYKEHKVSFNESVDLTVSLFIDPKKSDQTIKTNVILPNGNGKKPKVIVLSDGDEEQLIKEGAVSAGLDSLIESLSTGALVPGKDFDVCIASIDVMPKLLKSKAVKILGKAGLMPNAKLGTIGKDVSTLLKEMLSGKSVLKHDKNGHISISIGRLDFSSDQLRANLISVYEALKKAKPATIKGSLFKSFKISSTMMPNSFNIKMAELYAS